MTNELIPLLKETCSLLRASLCKAILDDPHMPSVIGRMWSRHAGVAVNNSEEIALSIYPVYVDNLIAAGILPTPEKFRKRISEQSENQSTDTGNSCPDG